jgi:alkylation response protein AidB-like acyl-CoA dehydrogenase
MAMINQDFFQLPTDLATQLKASAHAHDLSGKWPETDLIALEPLGARRWAVPKSFGGDDLDPLALHRRYEAIAAASLATALILTQRDSAIGILAMSENDSLRRELLPRLISNESFTTVGIAQLTTSRQGGAPVLRATPSAIGYELDGFIPWSTGACESEFIVAGAATEDGQQILFALPMDSSGVECGGPMPLVALRATRTSEIRCRDFLLEKRLLLRGPMQNVLAGRRILPLGQAFLALGHCRGILDLIATHDSDRARALHGRLEAQLNPLRQQVLESSASDSTDANPALRGACADLAVRAANSAVALFKGSALLADHPAQRLAREAMFLLVWSCPDPVIDCTVDILSGGATGIESSEA